MVDGRAMFGRAGKSAAKANDAPSGTKKAGFVVGGNGGSFKCGNCVHMSKGTCQHPEVIADQEAPHNADGAVPVNENDCCEYQRRPGDK
jgi:hypothetical protein